MIKEYSVLICVVSILVTLTACNHSKEKIETSFRATVLDSQESYLLVEPGAGSKELSSADKIMVSIGDIPLSDSQDAEITSKAIAVGDQVEVFYDGLIAESYPAQIDNCYRVKLLD